jgi:hypothetical protein
VSRPVGLRVGRVMALSGVMNNRRRTSSGNVGLAYQTLAGPTGFACSGLGNAQDDVSWASFRSLRGGSHSMTAMFDAGRRSSRRCVPTSPERTARPTRGRGRAPTARPCASAVRRPTTRRSRRSCIRSR